MIDQADEHEVGLVFQAARSEGLWYVRVRSNVKGCAWPRSRVRLARDGDDGEDEGRLSAAAGQERLSEDRIQVERQSLIDMRHLRTADDFHEPDVRSISESDSSFTFLDWRNGAVKRIMKVGGLVPEQISPGDISTLYKADFASFIRESNLEERLTGMCVVDEESLIVVRGNCHVSLVDSTSARRVHSLRLANFRMQLVDQLSFVIPVGTNRLFVAVESDIAIYEIEWGRERTNWRVAKVHTLPDSCFVGYLDFDDASKRFALGYYRQVDGRKHWRVSVLDERIVEATNIPLVNVDVFL